MEKNNYALKTPLVFDGGSSIIKAGFGGDLHPLALFPSQGSFQPWIPDLFGDAFLRDPQINSLFPESPTISLDSVKVGGSSTQLLLLSK